MKLGGFHIHLDMDLEMREAESIAASALHMPLDMNSETLNAESISAKSGAVGGVRRGMERIPIGLGIFCTATNRNKADLGKSRRLMSFCIKQRLLTLINSAQKNCWHHSHFD